MSEGVDLISTGALLALLLSILAFFIRRWMLRIEMAIDVFSEHNREDHHELYRRVGNVETRVGIVEVQVKELKNGRRWQQNRDNTAGSDSGL